MGRAPQHLDLELADVGEPDGVVVAGPHGLAQVLSDLGGVHVECGDKLDVAHVVAAEVDVHEAGHKLVRVGILVVLNALDQRVGTVADPRDRYAYFAHSWFPFLAQISVASGAVPRTRRGLRLGRAARSFSINSSNQAMSASVLLTFRFIRASV